jgi:hypothetical protein
MTPRQRLITPGLPTSIQKAPSRASYLPAQGMGMGMDAEPASVGKGIRRQEMGSVVGRRGAGLSQITGGDQTAHSLGHYGKGGLPGLIGGSGGS